MLRSIIRSLGGLAIVLLAGACNKTSERNLLDGCYYLGEEPIFKIYGTQGNLLVPGDIAQFRLVPRDSSDYISVTTQPNFVIAGNGRRQVKSVGNLASPSPLIIIETESLASPRVLVHDNGAVARLIHRASCPPARVSNITQPPKSAATSGRAAKESSADHI